MPRFDLPLAELETYHPAVSEPRDFDDFWAATVAGSREAGGEVAVSAPLDLFSAVEVRDVTAFYPAEREHQDFYKKNAMQYRTYEFNCGRPQWLRAIWGTPAR